MATLDDIEQEIATKGLTHSLMLDFFTLIPTSNSTAILPTFQKWVTDLELAGVYVDTRWYDRMVEDFNKHGRLTAETLLQAEPVPIVTLGDDDAE